ncbi:hypothetical protein D9M73_70770 [compost metagenome]|nr:MAG TPA: hypothetical protein [Caudoviricetes sp.]
MKTLILASALALPVQQASSPVATLAPGQAVRCAAAEGCIVMTKRAMDEFLKELAIAAGQACAATHQKGSV